MKIVINKCFGGFGLSYEAVMLYAKLKGISMYVFKEKRNPDGSLISYKEKNRYELYNPKKDKKPFIIYYSTKPLKNGNYEENSYFSEIEIKRDDPILVQVVEKLGKEANGSCANLKIVEIPNNVEWEIEEYDGQEWVAEKHRTWG